MKTAGLFRLLFVLLLLSVMVPKQALAAGLPEDEGRQIQAYVEEQMEAGQIPGLSVVVVSDDETVFQEGFGLADLKSKRPVTTKTLFELGSTSKAFTGLAVHILQEKGLLNLSDPVSKYLPWFHIRYKDEYKGHPVDENVEITLEQLLHHTSGLPFKTIGEIPIAAEEDALERTVKMVAGVELDHYPGEKFSYATINYDVLGLVIQKVSGIPYEEFIRQNVLLPLGLKETYVFQAYAASDQMATGYKFAFLTPKAYQAPPYRGNTPAGYIITNAEDMARWLKIQLAAVETGDISDTLIQATHLPNRTVPPDVDGSSYASGWRVYQNGSGELVHGGSNPNFSTYIVIHPDERTAVAVMANLDSSYTAAIGDGILDIIGGMEPKDARPDTNKSVDNTAVVILAVSVLVICLTLVALVGIVQDLCKKRRTLSGSIGKFALGMLVSLILSGVIAYGLYLIPNILYQELPWDFVEVWAPFSLIPAIIAIFVMTLTLVVYFLLFFFFPKQEEKPFFPLIILSVISGFGNAFVIFTINYALGNMKDIHMGLVLYFGIGVSLYVVGQNLIRRKMVALTNDLIYNKRIQLLDMILRSSYAKIQKLKHGKLHTGLNDDTELISNSPSVIIGGMTDAVTLLFCFIYLGVVNFYGLLLSVAIIGLAVGVYVLVGRTANKLWNETRDTQNEFFRFINDLISGFKELKLSSSKGKEFRQDMEESCSEFRTKRTLASIKFTNAFIIGELLFIFVIGAVAFVFPYLFDDITVEALTLYIFVFLYMTGPVRGILNSIPALLRMRVSWQRVNELITELDANVTTCISETLEWGDEGLVSLELENVSYRYDEEKDFQVGPINASFHSGEIVFITGGNGSGKTTLGCLLTGLYQHDEGRILLNGKEIPNSLLGEYYSNVFSDFHLFKKLYGIAHQNKEDEIQQYLSLFQLDQKVEIQNGLFSSLNLSTGQRKRLALLVSYLEDKPIFIFDEWAADQDPEFRRFFYHHLLQDLKRKGKCVIAISHDDSYFHMADKVIKLEMGKIIETKKHSDSSEPMYSFSGGQI